MVVFRRIVLLLGSFHLTIMAALGIWLWSNPRSFGHESSCTFDVASTTILGHHIDLKSRVLRALSIVIYCLFLVLGPNLILPMGVFLWIFTAYQPSPPVADDFGVHHIPDYYAHNFLIQSLILQNMQSMSPKVFPTRFGLLILFAVNIIFLVDIELTLRRSRALQASSD
jgi:hypothetical protein